MKRTITALGRGAPGYIRWLPHFATPILTMELAGPIAGPIIHRTLKHTLAYIK